MGVGVAWQGSEAQGEWKEVIMIVKVLWTVAVTGWGQCLKEIFLGKSTVEVGWSWHMTDSCIQNTESIYQYILLCWGQWFQVVSTVYNFNMKCSLCVYLIVMFPNSKQEVCKLEFWHFAHNAASVNAVFLVEGCPTHLSSSYLWSLYTKSHFFIQVSKGWTNLTGVINLATVT